MKYLIGVLYLLTGLAGLYWAIWLTLTGLYAVPISPLYIVICIGAVTLLAAAVISWVSVGAWARWLPIAGSALLACCFVPAGIGMVQSYFRSEIVGGLQLATSLATVLLALASLATALTNSFTRRAR